MRKITKKNVELTAFDSNLNKKYQKDRAIKHLTMKYQYSNENKENKQVFINILCNMLKMKNVSLTQFYNNYKYFLLNYVNNEIENYIDNQGYKAYTYKQNKIKYHTAFNTNFKNLKATMENSSIKNSALYDYLIDNETLDTFKDSDLRQSFKLCEIEAKKIDNIPPKNTNIYSYSFVGYLATMKTYSNIMIALENKDLNYSFNNLLVLRQTIYKTLNRISNRALYNKYLFYYHCLNCIASVYNDYETENSFKEFKSVLYKAIA